MSTSEETKDLENVKEGAPIGASDLEAMRKLKTGVRQHQATTDPRHRRPGPGDRGAPDRALRPRPLHAGRRARTRQDPHDQHAVALSVARLQPHPVHAGPHARGHHRHGLHREEPDRPAASSCCSVPVRSSPTWCWPTRSTGRRRGRRPRSWKPCRSGRSRSAASATSSPTRSSSWPRRTRSSRKGPIPCRKRSRTVSCSRCS